MSTQLSLETYRPGNAPARARRSDSESSHRAADRISGRRAHAQKVELLRAVRDNPDKTTKELAELAGLDRHVAGRRAPELEEQGYIDRTKTPDGMTLALAAKGWALLEDLDTAERGGAA